ELVVGQSPGPLLEAVGRLDRALRARGVPALGGAHQLPEAVGESHARSFPVRISSPPRYAGPGPDGGPPRRSPLLAVRVELTAQSAHRLGGEQSVPGTRGQALRRDVGGGG